MMHIKPPTAIPEFELGVFLAGSIEMGIAAKWQDWVADELAERDLPIVVMNPRRDDWDSTWAQEESNPQFNEQVNWELQGLDDATHVLFYFDPATKSPITLAELGYVLGCYSMIRSVTSDPAHAPTIIVVCPTGFWRKGNVDIMCRRFGVPVYEVLAQGVATLIQDIKKHAGPEVQNL